MSNESSFNNGLKNLELQDRNLAGAQSPASDPPPAETAETADTTETAETAYTAPAEPPKTESSGRIHVEASVSGGIPHYGAPGTYSPYGGDYGETEQDSRTDKYNMASLILGISSFAGNFCCLSCLTPFAAILAIIFGCLGRREGRFQTKGLVGMILGIVFLSLLILVTLWFMAVIILNPELVRDAMNEAMSEVPYS